MDPGGDGAAANADTDVATYAVHDESRLLKLICARIASVPDKVVVEADLKVGAGVWGLGFTDVVFNV